jgi:hypothetical protein
VKCWISFSIVIQMATGLSYRKSLNALTATVFGTQIKETLYNHPSWRPPEQCDPIQQHGMQLKFHADMRIKDTHWIMQTVLQ